MLQFTNNNKDNMVYETLVILSINFLDCVGHYSTRHESSQHLAAEKRRLEAKSFYYAYEALHIWVIIL